MCVTVLGGELAVPCYLQSATVGPNANRGGDANTSVLISNVDFKVLCNCLP